MHRSVNCLLSLGGATEGKETFTLEANKNKVVSYKLGLLLTWNILLRVGKILEIASQWLLFVGFVWGLECLCFKEQDQEKEH